MWFTPEVRRILAYSKPVDLRKSIEGLVGVGKSVLEEDPLAGSLFVFVNRRGNYVKLVSWDRTGWCLFAKRLEHGRFRFPQAEAKQALSLPVFHLLLDGMALGGRPCRCSVAAMTVEEQAAPLRPDEIVALLAENAALKQQNEWFKRQLFGRKSQRRLREPEAQQLPLAGLFSTPSDPAETPPSPTETVKASQRRAPFTMLAAAPEESGLRFDSSVPVQEILLTSPAIAALPPETYEVSGEKVTYRLAQRPGGLCQPQVPSPGDQPQRHGSAELPARAARGLGEELCGCESPGGAPD